MLSINTGPQSQRVEDSLYTWESRMAKATLELSSGSSINSAADNPAGLAVELQLLGQATGDSQSIENSQDGISMLQTADGGLSQTQDLLQQARQLQVQSLNGTLTASDQQAINDQLQQINQQIDQISGNTQYNTRNLLDGTASNISLQTGANPGQTTTLSLANASSAGLGVSGMTANSATTLTSIDAAINQVSSQRATLGASINGLSATVNVQQAAVINMSASKAAIGDTDMASAASALVQSQIQSSSGIAMLTQASNLNSGLVKLL